VPTLLIDRNTEKVYWITPEDAVKAVAELDVRIDPRPTIKPISAELIETMSDEFRRLRGAEELSWDRTRPSDMHPRSPLKPRVAAFKWLSRAWRPKPPRQFRSMRLPSAAG
jgi:hypothetical protein